MLKFMRLCFVLMFVFAHVVSCVILDEYIVWPCYVPLLKCCHSQDLDLLLADNIVIRICRGLAS